MNPQDPWPAKRTWAFVSAMAITFFAIELFVGVYDDVLFYDHMIQHLLLLMVASPLIAMSAPMELLRRATNGRTKRVLQRVLDSRLSAAIGHPLVGFALYAALIPVAHLTSLYNFTLTNDLAHDNEHLAFLVVGYLFWRPVVATEPSRHRLHPGLRLLYLMAAVPVDAFTGVTLVSARGELFSYYETLHRTWGPSLVTDLHIGGSIMWAGGGTLMTIAMIPVVVSWVREEDEKARRIDQELDRELDGDFTAVDQGARAAGCAN